MDNQQKVGCPLLVCLFVLDIFLLDRVYCYWKYACFWQSRCNFDVNNAINNEVVIQLELTGTKETKQNKGNKGSSAQPRSGYRPLAGWQCTDCRADVRPCRPGGSVVTAGQVSTHVGSVAVW